LAIHEIAGAAELAVAAESVEKPDADALADRPSLHAVAERIYAADCLVTGYAWPVDREDAVDCAGIGVTYAAGFNANAQLAGTRVAERFGRQLQLAGSGGVNGPIGRSA
jgi:hypothetical protein